MHQISWVAWKLFSSPSLYYMFEATLFLHQVRITGAYLREFGTRPRREGDIVVLLCPGALVLRGA